MEGKEKNGIPVIKEELVSKVESEVVRLKDATDYRKETARLSLVIAGEVEDVQTFYNKNESLKIIEEKYPGLDVDRKQDVSKFLRVVTKDIEMRRSIPKSLMDRVNDKMKNSKLTVSKIK